MNGTAPVTPTTPRGTAAYENWHANIDGHPRVSGEEYLLYSDAHVTGEVLSDIGPYQLFNLLPAYSRKVVKPVIALRCSYHIDRELPDMSKTDAGRYHGGDIADELAALVSLRCGIRLRATGPTRIFGANDDSHGRPVAWFHSDDPNLGSSSFGKVLVATGGYKSMEPATGLRSLLPLGPHQCTALVRAARLYQEALWLSEAAPNLSWLLLVSAVETAAQRWTEDGGDRTNCNSPYDRVEDTFGRLFEDLRGRDAPSEVVEVVRRHLSEHENRQGKTRKFREFVLAHLPPEPQERPDAWAQVDWSEKPMRKVINQIYDHRSKALHDGVPFPMPMCGPPLRLKEWHAFAEKPLGLAASSHDAIWLSKDLPMHLHIFEYIARESINRWWSEMANPETGVCA